MEQSRSGSVTYLLGNAFHRMVYSAYGDPAAPPVVCVHGLTRNRHDFAPLAEALSDRFHVICPDLPGRGASDWLADPNLYQPLSYVAALSYLMADLGDSIGWVGTSLGGICGMVLAATPGNRISRMVLNDIGPHIPKAAAERIFAYMSGPMRQFTDIAELEAYLRRVHAPFGPLTDAQWSWLAQHSARTLPDGMLALHYDPAIMVPIEGTTPQDANMWPLWQAITIPMLTLRGESSDLLLAETAEQMAAKSQIVTIAETGHAPMLMDEPTIARIKAFLLE